jgi:GalNAc-alpha-(1->4)-GalNAc-alpha-(1->3)-diNAcBac-PP-undecaprenol alpha-1,4-N-acetyl-D-galactosaminyltransferase
MMSSPPSTSAVRQELPPARKIMLLVSSMQVGGAERTAANLANAWAARGDHVVLVITYSGAGECFYELAPGVDLRYLADRQGVHVRDLRSYLQRFRRLRRMIRDERPDVLVSFLTNVNVAAIVAASCLDVPVVVCEHTYPPLLGVGTVLNALRHWTYARATRVTMLTPEGLRWLESAIPRAHGVVMPNPIPYPLPGVEPRLAPDAVLAPHRKLLLAVGRLSEEKGLDRLIDAFSDVAAAHPDWDLVVLGEGPLRAALQAQVSRLELDSRVVLPGRVGNVADWYERADLYALSSRVEGFPNTLGEAMAHGCAAVSFDCDTGPRDLIRDGVDGLLVRPVGDVAALAAALDRLMRDDETRSRMGQAALHVRERYSIDAMLARWDALFAQVAAAR